jgi:hypothetical protein
MAKRKYKAEESDDPQKEDEVSHHPPSLPRSGPRC